MLLDTDREKWQEISFTSLSINCIIIRLPDALKWKTEKTEQSFLWNSISWLPVDAILWLAILNNNATKRKGAREREAWATNLLDWLNVTSNMLAVAVFVRQKQISDSRLHREVYIIESCSQCFHMCNKVTVKIQWFLVLEAKKIFCSKKISWNWKLAMQTLSCLKSFCPKMLIEMPKFLMFNFAGFRSVYGIECVDTRCR